MDGTTNEERALIDAAVAAGRVTKLPPHAKPGGYESKRDEIQGRRKVVAQMVDKRMSFKEIANEMGVCVGTIAADCRALGIKGKGRKGRKRVRPVGETADQKRARKANDGVRKVSDRRRFKVQPVPMGQPAKMAPSEATGTIFPDRVFDPGPQEPVLKDGCHNAKIGGDVLVGWLKGARIYTLTLEERATCPRSCKLWEGCYGNTMQHSRRWNPGRALEDQIESEIEEALEKWDRILVRLHILGDFYSVDYVTWWAYLLMTYPGLHVFGFTAWPEDTEIGAAVDWLRRRQGRRFAVRTSGRTGHMGSFALPFPTEAKMIGDALVCPEQLDAAQGSPQARHCGNCAACWSDEMPLAFIMH